MSNFTTLRTEKPLIYNGKRIYNVKISLNGIPLFTEQLVYYYAGSKKIDKKKKITHEFCLWVLPCVNLVIKDKNTLTMNLSDGIKIEFEEVILKKFKILQRKDKIFSENISLTDCLLYFEFGVKVPLEKDEKIFRFIDEMCEKE